MSTTWKDAAKIAVKVLPILGTVLGGPMGAIAGAGGALLAEIFGCEATPMAVSQALSVATPDQILKIKEMELGFNKLALEQIKEQNRHTEEEQSIDKRDIADARISDVRKTEATGGRDTNLYILAWVTVIGFFVFCIAMIYVKFPESETARTMISVMAGALVAGYKDVLGYFFGSSKSSQDKTQMIANLGNK